MHVERYLQDHQHIQLHIEAMRTLSHAGAAEHAEELSRHIAEMAGLIKLHLSLEDHVLYPALAQSADAALAGMAKRYQHEMDGLEEGFEKFVAQWRLAARIKADPEAFRSQANAVLKALYERLQRENAEFFPAVAGA